VLCIYCMGVLYTRFMMDFQEFFYTPSQGGAKLGLAYGLLDYTSGCENCFSSIWLYGYLLPVLSVFCRKLRFALQPDWLYNI
jgi:hypothetical protein